MKNFIAFYVLLVLILWSTACNHLEVEPVDLLTDQTTITNANTTESALLGLYSGLQNPYGLDIMRMDLLSDETNDKLNRPDPEGQLDGNAVLASNFLVEGVWQALYKIIRQTNFILERVPRITTIPVAQRESYLAEAYFIRAFCNFQLVRYFGGVPLLLTTDIGPDSSPARVSRNEVFDQIIEDLQQAEAALPVSYNDPDEFKTRATRTAATALLARAYLYTEDWIRAEEIATQVIDKDLYQMETNYTNLYNKNSPEVIWELFYPVLGDNFTAYYSFPGTLGGIYGLAPSDKIVAAFEPGDQRFEASLRMYTDGTFYIYKYRDPNINGSQDRPILLRLAELYLIRAEARAQLDNTTGAAQDINVIRSRVGLSNTSATSKEALLLAIEQERFVEFCFENHRFPDLVRTGRANAVLGAHNPNGWQPTDQLLPLPQSEMILNPNLVQNEGY
ncbi:MAG: RagB/SusD family nutrient uptake outer membrane protein [Cytophagales bacterium]|nr:RagB/SusD family nutrient uptake outer membrane protein [Cytophagales bacterium]